MESPRSGYPIPRSCPRITRIDANSEVRDGGFRATQATGILPRITRMARMQRDAETGLSGDSPPGQDQLPPVSWLLGFPLKTGLKVGSQEPRKRSPVSAEFALPGLIRIAFAQFAGHSGGLPSAHRNAVNSSGAGAVAANVWRLPRNSYSKLVSSECRNSRFVSWTLAKARLRGKFP